MTRPTAEAVEPLVSYPLSWEADVLLRDGHPVHLRPISPADAEALRAFHRGLSARTVYLRFFAAKPELTDADVAYFTGVDHRSRVALVALDRDAIVGVGRFDVVGDGGAEVAFIVRDDLQGLGLGSVLLEHLAAAARELGVRRFVAEVLPENARMLMTFREAGYALDQRREDDVIAVAFDIEPTQQSRAVMAAREHRAEARSMERMLRPETVAVVGASREPRGLGHAILRHLADAGFTGRLFAVHPEVDTIDGVPCVRRLADIDGGIDLAVVVVPAGQVLPVVEDAAAAGVHGLVVVSGGLGESGEGADLQAELVATVNRTGMRLVGPNALGLSNTDPAVRLNASLVPRLPVPGTVGFFCQSGALGSSILDRCAQRGVGISTFVSAGNRADVSGNDLLQYWEEDPATEAVILHLETIGNGRKFARLVHRISPVKPVVMVRTGGRALVHPLGHAVVRTGLSQAAVDQILEDCGLIVVDTVDRLLDVARVTVGQDLPRTDEVAVIGNSDALAVLAENALAARGLTTAGAPTTFVRYESPEVYRAAILAAVHDPRVGAVLAIHVPPIEGGAADEIRALLRRCTDCGEERHAPVVAVMSAAPADPVPGEIPVFRDVEDAVHALAVARSLQQWRTDDARRTAADAADEAAQQADDHAAESDAGLPAGGVLEGDAAARLVTSTGRTRVVMDLDASGSVGCEITLLDDPLFGPVISVAVDDPVATMLGDRQHRLAPVTVEGARDMLRALGAREVLVRGSDDPGGDLAVLAQAVSDVSHLHLRRPGVRGASLRHATTRGGVDLVPGDVCVELGESLDERDLAARRLA